MGDPKVYNEGMVAVGNWLMQLIWRDLQGNNLSLVKLNHKLMIAKAADYSVLN